MSQLKKSGYELIPVESIMWIPARSGYYYIAKNVWFILIDKKYIYQSVTQCKYLYHSDKEFAENRLLPILKKKIGNSHKYEVIFMSTAFLQDK